MNAKLFTDGTFDELIEKLKGFSHEDATPNEQSKFISALKILAEETIARHQIVRQMQLELQSKLTQADLFEQMSDVLNLTHEGKAPARVVNMLGMEVDETFLDRLVNRWRRK